MRRWPARICRALAVFGLTVLGGGFLTATLVRLSPGFTADEELLDTRLNEASLSAIRAAHDVELSLPRFYWRQMTGLLRGDLGISHSLRRPVRELFAARLPVTGKLVGVGLAGGWLLGIALALSVALWRAPFWGGTAAGIAGLFLSLPSAVIALAIFYCGGPVRAVIALVLFPRIFHYVRNTLSQARRAPHVLAAHARGLSAPRVFLWHILPISLPQLLALAGVSVSMALSAAIPIEVICDLPGIGQLAWKAALARDMPLLVDITFLIVIVTQSGNLVADCILAAWGRRTA